MDTAPLKQIVNEIIYDQPFYTVNPKQIDSLLKTGASAIDIIDLNKETEEGYYHEFKVWEFRFKGTTKEPM